MTGATQPGGATLALCLLLMPAAVLAQTPGTDPAGTQLTLQEVLARAADHNPAYRRAINTMELAGPQGRQAWGAFLPNLSLNSGSGYGFNEREVGEDDFGNPISNPDVQRIWNSNSNLSLSFNLTLFEGLGRFHTLNAARSEADATTWAARAELTRVEAEVRRQFFLAQLQSELLAVEDALLAARRNDLDATQRLFAIAARTQSDVLGAQLEVQRSERARDQQAAERAKALVALEAQIGDPDLALADVQAVALPDQDPGMLDEEALVDRALDTRAILQQRSAEVDQSQAIARSARARRWPTLSVGGNLYRAAQGRGTDFLFDPYPTQSRYGSLSFQLSIPLFTRFETSYQIAQADVARANAQESLREARLTTERDVRQALIDLRGAHRQLTLRGAERDVATRRLELVREEYRLAVRDFTELQTAVREEADARRQEVQARYDLTNAWIALEEVTGLSLMDGEPAGGSDASGPGASPGGP